MTNAQKIAAKINRDPNAKLILADIAKGLRVFAMDDRPHGWSRIESLGVAVRAEDGQRAELTDLGRSVTTPVQFETQDLLTIGPIVVTSCGEENMYFTTADGTIGFVKCF